MMTGTVPNFIDVILNFGSKSLQSDSLLHQLKRHGHRLVFYGDDTWLSLFPYMFDRHDGTTSFFVTDFTEVDNNVTRHIRDELNHDDWTVMILHYLGLDHIGHVEGPFGASIKPKLREMDEIVAQIAQKVQNWNNDGVSTLLVVCGDHGMKDSGGHGGSTPQETTVPFVTIGGTRCLHQEDGEPIEIEQLDVAATLSAALGLPIPSTNLGSIFLDSIYNLDDAKRLFLFHYNSRQVFEDRFRKLTHHQWQIEYIHRKYLSAVNLYAVWLSMSGIQNGMVENIVSSYNTILKEMKDTLISSIVEYDFFPMAIAVLFLCQIILILFSVQNIVWTTRKKTTLFFLVRCLLCLGLYYLYSLESTISFYTMSILNMLLFLYPDLVIGVLYINYDFCVNNSLSLTKFTKGSRIRVVFQIGTLLHIASFGGSSFIEEEHQTWYFLWASTITYFLYCYSTKLLMHYRYVLTSIKMRTEMSSRCSDSKCHVGLCVKLLLILIGHRVLRKLNSTGDKWAHLPDIARWLKEDDSKVAMTLLLLTALILLIWIAYRYESKEYRQQSLFFNLAIAACIYLRHMSNGAVIKILLYPPSSGIYEVRMFWGITALFVLSYVHRTTLIIKHDKRRFSSTVLFFIVNIWVTISAMLHQPYNVILLPMQIIASSTIDAVLRENDLLNLEIFVHCWLGNVFYFYQGNSNSLASIDVAVGYVGLRSYMPFVTGVYLVINTYSAPVLAYFLLVYYRQLNQTSCTDTVMRTSRSYIAWRLLTITVYMIIVISQRHHLFVWSVFSPKLLYEAAYSVTMCCSVLLTLTVTTITNKILLKTATVTGVRVS
ncbi:GPI ethanolamine phosphate transferase 2 isoform X2 [Monomorium pharaonis]|nr:GPI ethanolamine phosphate transferase 2 isoform X2 [Monomorium pharaonis]